MIRIPNENSIQTIKNNQLPDGWHKTTNYSLYTTNYPLCQQIGDAWVDEGRSLLLRVVSSIIQEETSILINPAHPEFPNVSIQKFADFRFDDRL